MTKASRLHPYAVLACASLLCLVTASAFAQEQATGVGNRGSSLTEGLLPKTADTDGSATVAGTVLDVSGASVAGAEVSLRHKDGTELHTMLSGTNGEFNFVQIPSGSYLVIVNAKNFAPFASAEFVVAAEQTYDVPNVSLSVAAASTEMTVHPDEFIAAEQIKAAEKQRLIGIIPNFYTSYIPDAVPLTVKQKFSMAARGTFDPVAVVGVGIGAGIEQAMNSYPGYGQGAVGYAKRFGAKFADGRDSDFLTHAVFPSLFHQDPRYYYQGSGSVKERILHAVGSAFIIRSDSGLSQPNYSYILGDMSSAALSNLYYPRASRGVHLVFTNAAMGLAGRAAGNILREFSKRATTNTPRESAQP
ncbi:MAG TPA: carboxypeptidase-like regulatory domain-containing protein [Candidatus Acidoferrales bacterium]|nr:carboxypeptidase-like regulatory domain-containing protein [Candidatus Acidoferrales bacterium]